MDTADKAIHRLVIEHIVQEGHGLDVTPKIIHRLKSAGDPESASVLEVILNEEVSHVTKGYKWFSYVCKRDQLVT
jgi:uncharacterized ferritin-like protein (DUF455 family)